MTTHAPKRRWFRFSLRTMFVVVTAASCWLGWNANIVHRRLATRVTIEANGGTVGVFRHSDPPTGFIGCGMMAIEYPDLEVPTIRAWLGDEPIEYIVVQTEAEVASVQAEFPEAHMVCDPGGTEERKPVVAAMSN
jgi:hypothetical protein